MKPLLPGVLAAILCGCHLPPKDHSRVAATLKENSNRTVGNVAVGEFSLPPGVILQNGLSSEDAASIALWNNAVFQEQLADLGMSRADVVQAWTLPNPTLSMLVPWGAKGLELTAKYPLEVLVLRPKRVAAAEAGYGQTVQRLTQSALDLVRDVKLAFADLLLAKDQARSAEQTARFATDLSQLARGRLAAGEASELEAGLVQTDALLAADALARAQREESAAMERLRSLLGMSQQPFPERLIEEVPARLMCDVALLATNALAARPDVRAAEIALESSGRRIGLARIEAFTLAAGVNAKDVNKEFLAGPTVDLAVPILNQNQGGIALAQAGFEKAARHYHAVKDRVLLEVRESHSRVLKAQESLDRWQRDLLPQFEESLRQSRQAHTAGEVSMQPVVERSLKLEEGRARAALARTELRRALAELERNLGGHLPPAASPETQK